MLLFLITKIYFKCLVFIVWFLFITNIYLKCLVLIDKESREWCQMIKAIIDDVGELSPEQCHASWEAGGYTGWGRYFGWIYPIYIKRENVCVCVCHNKRQMRPLLWKIVLLDLEVAINVFF